jgi:uncharacterized protein (TIGR00730 family)
MGLTEQAYFITYLIRFVMKEKNLKSESALGLGERWKKYWQKAGTPMYELPAGENDPIHEEREFLVGARTVNHEMRRLKRINAEFEKGFSRLLHIGPAVTVFGSARYREGHRYYELARKVGGKLAEAGFTVLTGGGPGLMEAANRGAFEAGGKSYGLNIILPQEQSANPYVNESIEFRYFFIRKVMLVKYSCAFIIMPGGLGTLDEMYEAATLIQCKKIGPFPLILMDKKFWKNIKDLTQYQVDQGAVGKDEVGFALRLDSPNKAVETILRSIPDEVRQTLVPKKL